MQSSKAKCGEFFASGDAATCVCGTPKKLHSDDALKAARDSTREQTRALNAVISEHAQSVDDVIAKAVADVGRYDSLRRVLAAAVEQASQGKGAERHDPNGERFEDQQIVQLGEWMRSTHFAIGQAVKKSLESTGLSPERARAELLGAINYLAAAVIVLERGV